MHRPRAALLSSALALALAATLAPAAAVAAAPAAPQPAGVSAVVDTDVTTRVADAVRAAANRTSADGITVITDDDGAFVSWTAPAGDRLTDARTEFRLPDGRVVQPTATGRTYGARVLGATDLKARDVAVVRGSKVLAGRADAVTAPVAPSAPTTLPSRPTKLVTKDPGTPGRYKTRAFTYSTSGMKVPGYDAAVETRAHVVMPRDAKGTRPVVVLLHGRHSVCYQGDEIVDGWPCPEGSRSIPSYLGYRDQQNLLASQGYVTVSISANGINAQDHSENDGGAGTRADLVRRHLTLLSQWNRGTKGPRGTEKLKGKLKLSRVVTVGHSRGGEGVSRAAIKSRAGDPFRIVGQVLVAPTDFATQVAIGIPTTVLLPSCDGDVSDLQGQAYVDRGVGIASGDHALRSSVLVLGANHNYFNSEWTPGVSQAPSWDDGEGVSTSCGPKAAGRLTAKQQRAVGATYVAAAVKAYVARDASARSLLDGSPVRARSAGSATVLSHAVGGRRTAVLTADRQPKVSTRGNAAARSCSLVPRSTEVVTCFGDELSPHGAGLMGMSALPLDPALAVGWTAKGARVRLTGLPNLSHRKWLTMRVVVPPQRTTPSFDLVLTDTAGRSATVKAEHAPSRMPAVANLASRWAQEVRFRLPARSKVDTSKLARVDLKARSASGRLVVLDAHGVSSGQRTSSASVRTVARVSVPTTTRITSADAATQLLRIPVTGTRTRSARVWVEHLDTRTWSTTGSFRTIKPGQTSLDVRLTVPEDDAVSLNPDGHDIGYVTVIADRGAVVDNPTGGVTAPAGKLPTLDAMSTDATATPGGSLRWELRLTEPTIEGLWTTARFAAVTDELAAEHLVPTWLQAQVSDATLRGPLSSTGAELGLMIPSGATSTIVEVPVRRTAQVAPARQVRLVVDRSMLGQPDLVLTGTVTPAP